MSRSHRKPYCSWANAGTMHNDKKIYHGRHRAMIRQAIKNNQDVDELYIPRKNYEVSDVWSMARDGKQYYVEIPRDCDDDWYKEFYKRVRRK